MESNSNLGAKITGKCLWLPSTSDPGGLNNSKTLFICLKKSEKIMDVANDIYHKRTKNQLQICCSLACTKMKKMWI